MTADLQKVFPSKEDNIIHNLTYGRCLPLHSGVRKFAFQNKKDTHFKYMARALSYFFSWEYKIARASSNNVLSESFTKRCSKTALTTAGTL